MRGSGRGLRSGVRWIPCHQGGDPEPGPGSRSGSPRGVLRKILPTGRHLASEPLKLPHSRQKDDKVEKLWLLIAAKRTIVEPVSTRLRRFSGKVGYYCPLPSPFRRGSCHFGPWVPGAPAPPPCSVPPVGDPGPTLPGRSPDSRSRISAEIGQRPVRPPCLAPLDWFKVP